MDHIVQERDGKQRDDGGRGRSRSRSRSRDGHPRRRYDGDDNDSKRRRSRSRSASPRRRARSPRRRRGSQSRSRSRSPKRRHHRADRSRSRSRSRSRERKHRRRSRSVSSHSSASDSDGRRRARRKDKEKRKKRSSRSRERRERRKEKKKKKKDKGNSGADWGKYGIISETDIYRKAAEFSAWLMEERKINPETISKENYKKEFLQFAEDFNTATLPHEKYYNMDAYERRMNLLRSGALVPQGDETYDPNADLAAHAGKHKRAATQESHFTREQLMELRKVQNERVEVGRMKMLGLEIKSTMGVRMDGSQFDE